MKVRISKNLKWLEKFLKRAKHMMPSLVIPRQVRSYRPVLSKEHQTLGACHFLTKTITLATHTIVWTNVNTRKRKKLIALSQTDILMTFAHELAHFTYDTHCYEQECYAETIFKAFGLKKKCPGCNGTGKVNIPYEN